MKNIKALVSNPYVLGAAAILILLIYLYIKNKKKAENKTNNKTTSGTTALNLSSTTSNSQTSTSQANSINYKIELKQGDKGDSVKELQRVLNLILAYKKANPEATSVSPNVLIKYDNYQELKPDGIFGDRTEALLKLIIGKTSASINEITALPIYEKAVYSTVLGSFNSIQNL